MRFELKSFPSLNLPAIGPCQPAVVGTLSLLLFAAFAAVPVLAQVAGGEGMLSGRVVNASTGAGVFRALVRIDDRARLTDQEGRFEFDRSNEDTANLEVIKPGFYAALDPLDSGMHRVRAGRHMPPVQVMLYPEALLTGTVTAADGEPLPGVMVTALQSTYTEEGHLWNQVAEVRTNAHGGFRLPVPAGEYRLETQFTPANPWSAEAVLPVEVSGESTGVGSGGIRIRGGEERHFDLQPVSGHSYRVSARIEGGVAGPPPTIIARSSSTAGFQVHAERTPTGEYSMQLPNGVWRLTASTDTPQGDERGDASVTVAGHDVSGVTIRLSPSSSLAVKLSVDSSGQSEGSSPSQSDLPAFNLMLQSDEHDPSLGASVFHLMPESGPTGERFFGFDLPPGSYHFQAHNSGNWYVKSAWFGTTDLLQQALVVDQGTGGLPIEVTVSNRTGTLKGTASLHGEPAVCWIYLVPSTPAATPFYSAKSDESGAFHFDNLPQGSYQAVAFEGRHTVNYRDPASLSSFSTHVQSVVVTAGSTMTVALDSVAAAEVAP